MYAVDVLFDLPGVLGESDVVVQLHLWGEWMFLSALVSLTTHI